MINTAIFLLQLSASCQPTMLVDRGGIGEVALTLQARISEQRCKVKFTNSPCLGVLIGVTTNDFQATCIVPIKELKKENKEDDKKKPKVDPRTTDPKCNSCHIPDHSKPGEDTGSKPRTDYPHIWRNPSTDYR